MAKKLKNNSTAWKVVCVASALQALLTTNVRALEDGVYVLKKGPANSDLKSTGNLPLEIERKLNPGEYKLWVRSNSNWNDRFEIAYSDDLDHAGIDHYVGLAVKEEMTIDGGNMHVFHSVGREVAEMIAALMGGKPELRQHPGHQLAVRFATEKTSYTQGKPITLSVSIQNVGKNAVAFREEKNTDIQSRNLSIGWGGPPDMRVKETFNHRYRTVLMGRIVKLEPGATVVLREEELRKWYVPQTVGYFRFIGSYEIEFYDPDPEKQVRPIWIDRISGEFGFYFNK